MLSPTPELSTRASSSSGLCTLGRSISARLSKSACSMVNASARGLGTCMYVSEMHDGGSVVIKMPHSMLALEPWTHAFLWTRQTKALAASCSFAP
jgi:hypothetical protein